MKRQKFNRCSNGFSRRANWHTNSKNVFAVFGALFMIAVLLCSLFVKPLTDVAASGIARSVIVELNDDPAAVYKAKVEKQGGTVSDEQLQAYRNSVTAKQDQFLSALRARGVNYEIDGTQIKNLDGSDAARVDYRFNLVLNAVTLKVPAAALPAIQGMPEVKRIHNNSFLRVLLDNSVPYINAPANYGQFAELTAFDNHREGFEGQGINIAVLDTGIDWSHPMFGGDPTPPRHGLAPPTAALNSNQKVIYYLPITGAIDDFGHGTHASADAAGYLGLAPGADMLPNTADDARMHGVAPQARLMGYKVCTAAGTCPTAATILSIEDSVSPFTLTLQPKPVAHVINLSLGGVGGPDDSSSVAASNAALMGTIVVASAGNEGPGEGTVGSPAAGRHVIAVGATTHPGAANANWSVDFLQAGTIPQARVGAVTPAKNLAAQSGFDRIKLFPMAGTPDPASGSIAQRYAFVNLPATGTTYPASVSGRIALVKGSGLGASFADRCNRASLAGAVGMILISTTTNPTAVRSTIPCAVVSPTDGEILIDAISSTDNNAVDPANGTLSELPVRLNPFLNTVFVGETASFSSRGPVQGLGQVKPDVTAPGVAIYAATSLVGAPVASMMDPTRYIAANGTSFSGPQVAGAVAIVKQAHLNWSPDMIRAAMINTATNLRTDGGVPKADNSADSINDQGGGLIDIKAAVDAKGLMGVEGDGIINPALLASHSFGEAPILNNRIVNTREVTVTIRDTSGQGGTYNLSTVNNRATNRDGVATSVSPSSVEVPAGGTATFTAKITIDGDKVRDTAITQFQWYIVANRAGGGKLRMPMYLQATPSLPSDQIASAETTTYTGTVLAGDAGQQRDNDLYTAENATYVDVPFQVGPAGLKIDATLSWDQSQVPAAGIGLPDLDFLLFDPNGNQIGSSGNSTGPEHIAANATIPGTYVYRAYGWANGPTDFEIESTVLSGGAAPAVQPFASDFTFGGQRFDFDGNYNLTWQPRGSVEAYEIEESTDGSNWTVARTVDGNQTSAAFSNVANGARSYRIRSITAGRIGKYVTIPSNTESITVARRTPADVTGSVGVLNKTIVFPPGSTEITSALKNNSSSTLFPTVRLEIVSVQSSGNTVTVANADNGGNGTTTPAVFDYSNLVGLDFAPNEETAARLIKFNNPSFVLFSYTVKVTAHVPAATTSSSTGSTGSGATSGGTTDTSGGTSSGGTTTAGGATGTQLLKFTVNPLTGIVTTQVLP